MSQNMSLWDAVKTTDPKYTKKAKKGAHNFTSIAPMYQVKMATEQWGSFGSSWGIEVGSELFSQTDISDTILINYDAVMFYPDGKLPIHACEKLAYMVQGKGYLKIDEEARKKVVTNALTKGLSMLGFNADIFTGQFDDAEYVNMIATEKAIEQAEDKEAEIQSKIDDLVEYIKKHIDGIENAKTIGEASGLHKTSIRHLERQKNIIHLSEMANRGITGIAKAFNKKQQEFNND